jgi:hypothetical protein
MKTNFEELNVELEDIVGGLFSVDTSNSEKDTCLLICTSDCSGVGIRKGSLEGTVTPTTPIGPGPLEPQKPQK